MFIQLKDGQPVGHAVTEDNFRLLFPNTSFSWPFTPADIEPLGFGIYDFGSLPELGTFEKAVEIAPVKDEYGRWRQTWAVEPMNDEEVAARTAQEWAAIRAKRNFLLDRSDRVVVRAVEAGYPVPAEWVIYRQALRDLPETQTDPFNIVWPSAPTR